MPIVEIIVVLIVAGLVWWLIESVLPIPDPFKTVIRVVLVLALCLWLLNLVGLLNLRT